MANKKEQWKEGMYGDEVREKIEEFAENGWESIPEDERDMWFSRFKFWGVFHHRSGQESYFMMRLANTNGQLDPGQLRTIGEVAREYADGPVENPEWGETWIDFTTRQSIQMHWLKLEDVPEIWEKLEAVGVHSRSAGGDTMRNITGCPVAGRDKHEFVDAGPVLDEITAKLREDDDLANMPRKFNISVTGCREGCAQDSINGIGLEPAEKQIDGDRVRGFNVRVGGGLGGREPRRARSLDIFVRPENAYEVTRAFVELYFDYGNRENRQKNRSRFFVDDWGTEKIREVMQEEYVNFELKTAGINFRSGYTYNAGRPPDAGKHDHVGVHEQVDGHYYVGLSVPVGRLTAAETIELADLAEEHGSGEVRLTRRQNPLIMDVPEGELDDLLAAPLLETHKPEPNPFQRGAMACTGTEFCSLALTETKARMAVLLRWLRENVDLPEDVLQLKIHYSGCTADCGQALTADIGLQGMRARKDGEMVEALDVGVGGGVGTKPSFVEWVRQRVPADEVPGMLQNLLEAFAAHRGEGQTFREWVDSTGTEPLTEFAEPEETDYEDPCLHDAKGSWYPFDDGESPAPTAPDGTPLSADD
ncbi:ferredoxin--nitrite reductase [Halobacteriales archaeon QS_4_66_20]|nr:MAG: ferredoxin--nitrite reductase [Halobacteriales archaeon QS_4_66_20]